MTGNASPQNVPFCVAADWGTSNLRLWVLARDGTPLRELRSEEGLTRISDRNFAAVLEAKLAEMNVPNGLPVVICGMAGSRQGWVEAPYVETPASLDTVLLNAVRVKGLGRDVRILPGIAQKSSTAPDVMRGEETQLLGISGLGADQTVCMPGTHCKWVGLRGRVVTGFTTFLTGELYSVFSTATLLKHSVDPAARVQPDNAEFLDTCAELIQAPELLTARLFTIRAAGLLHGLSPAKASALLSGLLIGAEIGAARKTYQSKDVTLVGAGRLGTLYEAALALAGYNVNPVDAEQVVRAGLHAAATSFWAREERQSA
jgi:2-dehydro-3-deoxygalactonokinase